MVLTFEKVFFSTLIFSSDSCQQDHPQLVQTHFQQELRLSRLWQGGEKGQRPGTSSKEEAAGGAGGTGGGAQTRRSRVGVDWDLIDNLMRNHCSRWVGRARVPMPASYQYVKRPEWQTDVEIAKGKQKKEMTRLDKQMRAQQERKRNAMSNRRAVEISIEGRKTAL